MHTTTKKNLGRSTRAGVIGRSSVSSPLCARCIARTHTHTAIHIRTRESRLCARAYWDKELCKHEFTSGGHYCPGPGASYPSGTSLAQSFLLVTLPVTSTSMRYDRYDTCLYVRTYAGPPPPSRRKCLANSDQLAGRHVEISARRVHAGIIFHGRREIAARGQCNVVKRIEKI